MALNSSQKNNTGFGAELAKNLIAGLAASFVAISLGAAFGILSIRGQASGSTLHRLPLSLASDTACTKTIEEHS